MIAIRGATTINADTVEEITTNTKLLLQNIISENKLDIKHIIAIFFTCTRDIKAAYPAKAARELGITQASLMCMQEMYVEGSLEKCIRLSLLYDKSLEQGTARHIYLNDAVNLRPDLLQN
ncbi:MAG: aroH [Clostridia bacterium]|jgi:chorismate mutase|nr:aroH [Clostridia bacterium]